MEMKKKDKKEKKCSKCKNIRGSNWFYCDLCWDYIGSKENGYNVEKKKGIKKKK